MLKREASYMAILTVARLGVTAYTHDGQFVITSRSAKSMEDAEKNLEEFIRGLKREFDARREQ